MSTYNDDDEDAAAHDHNGKGNDDDNGEGDDGDESDGQWHVRRQRSILAPLVNPLSPNFVTVGCVHMRKTRKRSWIPMKYIYVHKVYSMEPLL